MGNGVARRGSGKNTHAGRRGPREPRHGDLLGEGRVAGESGALGDNDITHTRRRLHGIMGCLKRNKWKLKSTMSGAK